MFLFLLCVCVLCVCGKVSIFLHIIFIGKYDDYNFDLSALLPCLTFNRRDYFLYLVDIYFVCVCLFDCMIKVMLDMSDVLMSMWITHILDKEHKKRKEKKHERCKCVTLWRTWCEICIKFLMKRNHLLQQISALLSQSSYQTKWRTI